MNEFSRNYELHIMKMGLTSRWSRTWAQDCRVSRLTANIETRQGDGLSGLLNSAL